MSTAPAYPFGATVNDALNMARSRISELVLTPGGYPGGSDPGRQFNEVGGGANLSTDVNADGSLVLRTQVILNAGWKRCQKYVGGLGYRKMIVDNFILVAIPANVSNDPAVQSWISWNGNGTFNGSVNANFTSTPALPSDFLAPLKMEERVHGQNSSFFPMRPALDGIRTRYSTRTMFNRVWEWRETALYLPGANQLTDIQLRYTRRLPDFPDSNYFDLTVPWYFQVLPIPYIESSLAWYVVAEALSGMGDDYATAAANAETRAQNEADAVFDDQARSDQRTNNRRRPRGYRNSSRGGRF